MKKHFILGIYGMFIFLTSTAQWTTIPNYPGAPNDGCLSFVIGNKAYVGGGTQSSDFYEYNPATNTWANKTKIGQGTSRAWAASFTFNGTGYAVGGDSATYALLDDMWAYHPGTNEWTKKASFPGGRRDGMFAWVIGNYVYVGGGFNGTTILNDFYRYDPVTDSWTTMGNTPTAVLFASAFVHNGIGYYTLGDGNNTNRLWSYNPSGNLWEEKAPCLLTARSTSVAYIINNKAYVGLGQKSYSTGYTDFAVYDFATNQWSTDVTLNFPNTFNAWPAAFQLDNSIYAGTGAQLPGFIFTNKFFRYQFSTTGINTQESEQTHHVFPNPFNKKFSIHYPAAGQFYITNLLGQHVFSGEVLADSETIIDNLEELKKGMYMLTIRSDAGNTIQQVILKD